MHNGGFTIGIPLISLPGRAGHNLNISISYNSKQLVRYLNGSVNAARFNQTGQLFTNAGHVGRWRINIAPRLRIIDEVNWPHVYEFITPDGSVHNLYDYGGGAVSEDGTNMLYDPNTQRLHFLSGEHFDFSDYDGNLKIYHVDKNGNRITYQFSTSSAALPDKIIDTLGREVTFANN